MGGETPREGEERRAWGPEDGGDPACWLSRVCPECGLLAEVDPPVRCARCGALVGED
ncbi:hypothetical protein [Streptomyces sp. NPDC005438]|uniref:hypothetical protein n=1 Tax=Streptomyces sp. NPDC005438 TaxID=3156880 RepID=UPI0033AB25F3